MIRNFIIGTALSIGMALPASAAVRELGASEIRSMVRANGGYSVAEILKTINSSYAGETIDVRAFDSEGLVYGILLLQDGGKVSLLVVDAVTGSVLSSKSTRALEILTAIKNNPKKASSARVRGPRGNNGKGHGASNANGGNSGNNGAGSSGNSGGNGGGNGGGGKKK